MGRRPRRKHPGFVYVSSGYTLKFAQEKNFPDPIWLRFSEVSKKCEEKTGKKKKKEKRKNQGGWKERS